MTATAPEDPPAPTLEALRRENEALRRELALARSRLNAGEGVLERAFEDVPLPYHSLDPEGRIIMASRGWLELFGYSREEVLGRRLVEFMPPE